MSKRNISICVGLINKAIGVVKKLKWSALRREQIEVGELPDKVLINFDDDKFGIKMKDEGGCVVITTAAVTKSKGEFEHPMLRLILSWTFALHK